MNEKELILKILEDLGLNAELDNEGDIKVQYQMKAIYVMPSEDESHYVCVMLPQFHAIEEGTDTIVLAVCNKMSRDMKIVKVFIDQTFTHVTATYEFFYTDEESLKQNLFNSLQIMGIVRSLFRDDLAELEDESRHG